MPHPVAGRNTQAFGAARKKLKNGADLNPGRDAIGGEWCGMRGDRGHYSVLADKQHIECQRRVLHPHGDMAFDIEIEQHAAIRRHGLAPHQAGGALIGGARHFDLEQALAARSLDGQRLQRQFRLLRMQRQSERQGSAYQGKRQDPAQRSPAPENPLAASLHCASLHFFPAYCHTRTITPGSFARHSTGPGLAYDLEQADSHPAYFILLEFFGAELGFIRDFRYARYAMTDARWEMFD